MSKSVIVSGIQPTGNLHIGNYLGAVKSWVDLQNSGRYDLYIFIADLHALTGVQTAAERSGQILATAAELLAAGIDPEKTTFFVQSHVPEHTELGWIFHTVTPVAELYRMTQFKDKSERQEKNINAGLLTYPILQAADILLYQATQVPIGQDQVQHLELTNDIARRFNSRYGGRFAPVKPLLTSTPKIMSLLAPDKKMSKSLGAGHALALADEPEVVLSKLKKAVTATEGGGGAPGAANLLLLLKQFGQASVHKKFAEAEKNGTIQYGQLKAALAEAISSAFADFRARRAELVGNPGQLADTLARGAKSARAAAGETMREVRALIGLR